MGTVAADETSIKNFLKKNSVEDKAIAHVFGKNKNKARVVYGLYKTYGQAQKAINNFDNKLKENKPFPLKMKNFQKFLINK